MKVPNSARDKRRGDTRRAVDALAKNSINESRTNFNEILQLLQLHYEV